MVVEVWGLFLHEGSADEFLKFFEVLLIVLGDEGADLGDAGSVEVGKVVAVEFVKVEVDDLTNAVKV